MPNQSDKKIEHEMETGAYILRLWGGACCRNLAFSAQIGKSLNTSS